MTFSLEQFKESRYTIGKKNKKQELIKRKEALYGSGILSRIFMKYLLCKIEMQLY